MFTQIADCFPKMERVRVRRFSKPKGQSPFFKQITRKETQVILLAAKKFDKKYKQPGRKNGALGAVAIEVLEYLINCVDYTTGRLEPAIQTIMSRIRRSKDAIVRGLKNLRQHGFIDWIRRYVPTGKEYPPVEQTSNAYRLLLPPKAAELVDPVVKPDDEKTRQLEKQEATKKFEREFQKDYLNSPELWDLPEGLAASMLALWKNIKCESDNQSENQTQIFHTKEKEEKGHGAPALSKTIMPAVTYKKI